jgi:hypothetical protein
LDAVRGYGWTPAQIRSAVAGGRLVRPARGVLSLPGHSSPADTTLYRARAALLTAPAGAVVSHTSAADIHDLWQPRRPDGHVHLIVPGDHDDVDHGVRLHGSALPPHQVVNVDGVAVTSVARTAVDIGRGPSLPDALIALDSACRVLAGARSREALRDPRKALHARDDGRRLLWDAYQAVWSWPGTRVIERGLDLLEPASESPFESWSRGWMVVAGLPYPTVAHHVRGISGRWYWSDFAWPGRRVLAEADGLGKYGATDAEVRESLAAERHRQRDLEAAGWRFERWDSREKPRAWLARLSATLYASPLQVS